MIDSCAMLATGHTALTQPDKGNTFVRMFFIDYKLALIPSKQVSKLVDLGLETSICLLHASGFLTSFLLPSAAHLPIHIGDAECDSSAVLSSLWCAHHREPLLDTTHRHHGQECLPVALFLTETEEV